MGITKKIERLVVYLGESINEAMKRLNETAQKNIYVIDRDNRLIGSLSDGDIRRGIISGVDLANPVEILMNKNPKYILKGQLYNKTKIKTILLENHIESIPVLTNKMEIIDVIYWADVFGEEKVEEFSRKSTPVFILAGGFGTRLDPFTKVLPKPLIPIGEQPILEKIMDSFNKYGFSRFIISLNYKSDMIKAYFGDPSINKKYCNIRYIKEKFPMGTIGSLGLVKNLINETFFISNCDILVEANIDEILRYHKKRQNLLTIVGCIKKIVIPYGTLTINNNGDLLKFEEKPEYNHVISTGLYVAEPEIIKDISIDVKEDMTNLIDKLITDNKKIGVYPIIDSQWFDIGQWAEYEQTRKYFESKF